MIEITGQDLSIEEVIQVAFNHEKVNLSKQAAQRVQASQAILQKNLKKDFPLYGINTGYGIFHNQKISTDQLLALNRNLIISHAIAVGELFEETTVRSAMLIRANTLAKGFSGIRVDVIQTLLDMLNENVTPQVRQQGSMGSSGDLCQLAQMALVLTTDDIDLDEQSGAAWFKGKLMSGKAAMHAANIQRIILQPKEGLALINGATFSAALAVISCWMTRKLCLMADSNLALSLEALAGRREAFDPRLHEVRGMNGQIRTAAYVWEMVNGSQMVNSTHHVQDGYAIRCAPQVHGAVWDTLEHAEKIITKEINAATDNPLLFENGDVISGGNFHGEPIAFIMDFLGIALAELGAISERRIFRLLDSNLNNGLPLMLIADKQEAGIESGLMIPQYAAASLVMENQHLANSDAVYSIPTSANQEDHNSNSLNAARHAIAISENVLHILTIEMYTVVHALDIRMQYEPLHKMAEGTHEIYKEIRAVVPFKEHETLWGDEINTLLESLQGNLFKV
ncbi:MAG TPA: histidine ammonia-lyase [Anaerolineaceae bacterium]|nr:histidine ammonia-lyase [Anaerolineaceae bacterium]